MTDDGVVEVSVYIAAQPETVFPYFTVPGRRIQWMGSGATLEPVPAGEFVEVDAPRRVVFTWGWTHDHAVAPGTTRVVVTLYPENGGTRVVLRHHDLPNEEQGEHHRKGWEFYLGRLDVRVRGDDPGPDPNA